MTDRKHNPLNLGTITEMICGCRCEQTHYSSAGQPGFNIVQCNLHRRARRMADALSAVRVYLGGDDYRWGKRLEEYKTMIDEVLFGIDAESKPTRSVPR